MTDPTTSPPPPVPIERFNSLHRKLRRTLIFAATCAATLSCMAVINKQPKLLLLAGAMAYAAWATWRCMIEQEGREE